MQPVLGPRLFHRPPRSRGASRLFLSTLGLLCAALCACSTGMLPGDGADLSVVLDLRQSPGNPLIGQVCDDTRKCPASGGATLRCAVAQQNDAVGFCAVPCTSDTECDTVLPGRSLCTRMVNANRSECVIFCGANRTCPTGWSCIGAQGFNLCQPPQAPPVPPDMR